VYITGSTRSADFPTTPGAFQEDFAGGILACGTPPFDPLHNCEDAFVTKLATDGSGVIYSTYLGGSIVDVGHDIAVDGGRCAYLVGYTISPDFPGSDEPFGSIVVSKLNAAGSELIYTFTKTSGSADSGNSIAIGPTGDVYFAAAVHVPADFYAARITAGFTSVAAQEETRGAATVRLGPGTPNPFNTETTIRYDLSGRERVDLRVFDVAGHLVQVLESGDEESAGRHEVTWTGRDRKGREVPPGVYFYRLEAGDYTETRRIVLIR
jgi:hypothetical protein